MVLWVCACLQMCIACCYQIDYTCCCYCVCRSGSHLKGKQLDTSNSKRTARDRERYGQWSMVVQTHIRSPIAEFLPLLFDIVAPFSFRFFFVGFIQFSANAYACSYFSEAPSSIFYGYNGIEVKKYVDRERLRERKRKHKNKRIMFTCIYMTRCFESRDKGDVKWCVCVFFVYSLLSILNAREVTRGKKHESGLMMGRTCTRWKMVWVSSHW